MNTTGGSIGQRMLEGVLIYLNSFLILDVARDRFQEHKLWGAIAVLVMTIIIFWFVMRDREAGRGPVLILPEAPPLVARRESLRRTSNRKTTTY